MRAYLLLTIVLLSGCSSEKVHVSIFTPDEHIRSKLLAHTPLGSSGTNVLRFVVDDLRPHKNITSYHRYAESLEAAEGHRLPVGRTDWGFPPHKTPHKTIDVELGGYPVGLFLSKFVEVRWIFNEEDVLTNIVVERRLLGP